MANLRHKDGNWSFPSTPDGRIEKWEYVQIAVLMDIRDELKEINRKVSPLRHLDCHNFQRIPRVMDAIRRNTNKKKRVKKNL